MAGEDYTSPITGLTYTIPKYEEPADAVVAFKGFADSIEPGIGEEPVNDSAVLQVATNDGGDLEWVQGMSLQVADELPDSARDGDVVFIVGDDTSAVRESALVKLMSLGLTEEEARVISYG